ncbi:hypothetical protein CFC21_092541, partial [Triticum aestivum]
TRPL